MRLRLVFVALQQSRSLLRQVVFGRDCLDAVSAVTECVGKAAREKGLTSRPKAARLTFSADTGHPALDSDRNRRLIDVSPLTLAERPYGQADWLDTPGMPRPVRRVNSPCLANPIHAGTRLPAPITTADADTSYLAKGSPSPSPNPAARHMALKVGTDLKRMQRFYGWPSDSSITAYETEIVALLKEGYLSKVSYGFQRGGQWVEPSLHYTAQDLAGSAATDDNPGGIKPGANIESTTRNSFLIYSDAWNQLSPVARAAFEAKLPFSRTSGSEPGMNGYLVQDRTYSAGGRALGRASLRNFS